MALRQARGLPTNGELLPGGFISLVEPAPDVGRRLPRSHSGSAYPHDALLTQPPEPWAKGA